MWIIIIILLCIACIAKLSDYYHSKKKIGTFVVLIKTDSEGKESILVIKKFHLLPALWPCTLWSSLELPGSYTPEYQCAPASFALNELGIQTGLKMFSLKELTPVPFATRDWLLGKKHHIFLIEIPPGHDQRRYDVNRNRTKALWVPIEETVHSLKTMHCLMLYETEKVRTNESLVKGFDRYYSALDSKSQPSQPE